MPFLVHFTVSTNLTFNDCFVLPIVFIANKHWQGLLARNEVPVNVLRWYNFIASQSAVGVVLESLPDDAVVALKPKLGRQSAGPEGTNGPRPQEGKFVDLPHAEKGKVVVRFPPEASG